MRRVIKVLGIVLGVLIICLLLVALHVQFSDLPQYQAQSHPVNIQIDSSALAEGRRHAQMVCFQCHLNNNKLEGKFMLGDEEPFGDIWAPNITRHPEYGIGKYTEGELWYLLRTGIKNDGTFAPPWMPKFPLLSDRDMNDLIAYLGSDMPELEPSTKVHPPSELSFLSKALLHFVIKPLPYDSTPISEVSKSDRVQFGEYLATAKIDCFGCHSPQFETQNFMIPEQTPGFFTGGNPMLQDGNIVHSANLTPDPETGIGTWTEADFIKVMKTGIKPDGTVIRLPMTPYTSLNDEEISAIWSYLQSLAPVKNDIDALSS